MSEELKQAAQQALWVLERALSFSTRTARDKCPKTIKALERALTQRPAAQAGEATETAAFEAWVAKGGRSHQLRLDDHGMYADLTVVAWWTGWQARASLPTQPAAQAGEREAPYGYCPECGAPGVMRERRPDGDDKCSNGHRYPSRSAHASLPTQPAAQATPEPVGEAVASIYITPSGDREFDDWKCALPVGRNILYTRPAPGVPEGWRMDREGHDVIVVQHQAVGLARATNPATSVQGLILFMLCDDILQDHKSLAAAQAKGADHA